jgi:hypothetical protein
MSRPSSRHPAGLFGHQSNKEISCRFSKRAPSSRRRRSGGGVGRGSGGGVARASCRRRSGGGVADGWSSPGPCWGASRERGRPGRGVGWVGQGCALCGCGILCSFVHCWIICSMCCNLYVRCVCVHTRNLEVGERLLPCSIIVVRYCVAMRCDERLYVCGTADARDWHWRRWGGRAKLSVLLLYLIFIRVTRET